MRFEQAWVLFGAAIAAIVLLGTQRSFQSRAYDTALRSLHGRVVALEQNYAGKSATATINPDLFVSKRSQGETRRSLADSAESTAGTSHRRVFIDLGANCGNSYLKLKRQKVLEGKWEVYLWEANPQMVKFYLTALANTDPQVQVVPLAAWTENRKMKFFLTKGQENVTDIKQFKAHKCNPRSIHQPAGASSLFSGVGMGDDKKRKRVHQPGSEVEVDAVDFAAWFKDLALKSADEVILKIDIEGAEIPVLKKFITSATLPCFVDTYYVEWHSWMIADPKDRTETETFETGFLDTVAGLCNGRKPAFGAWH